jgi:LacI family transcriptional regulator
MARRPRVALLSGTFSTYSRDLIHGIHDYLREHKPWSIYLGEYGRGEILPNWLQRWKGDGIVARVENVKIARTIVKTGLPTVDVSFGLEHSPFPRVIMDNLAITKLAAEHLLERGFTHFGYCGENQHHWSRSRQDLFVRHIQTAGHSVRSFEGVGRQNARYAWELELDAIFKWLRELPKPVGIMACHDKRGQQVLEACRRLDIPVPDEVAVIGVHNDELLCELCDPPLSSVVSNARRVGYEAAALLVQMMAGQRVPAQDYLFEPVGVATRQSTDVVAVTDVQISKAIRFIREHACDGITVDDVLHAVPMSRTVFERRFKKLLNRTPHDQILRVRIERVKTLLVGTNLTLQQIAERTGFGHIEYLSVAFKRAVGDPPSSYRKRERGLPAAMMMAYRNNSGV